MREILFRGKRVDNGEWVEGYFANAQWYLDDSQVVGIFPVDLTLFPYSEFSEFIEIIPETVGQYTGLTDKNGKKIFEGDILKVHYEDYSSHKEFVGYIKYIVGAYGISYGQDRHFLEFVAMTSYIRGYEVIGNIHDNPELLEGVE